MLSFFRFDRSRSFVGSHEFDSEETKTKYSRQVQVPVLVLFGQRVHWLAGRHYAKEDLEPYRLLGDVEVDHILKLNKEEGSKDNIVIGGHGHGHGGDTIRACEQIYLERRNTSGEGREDGVHGDDDDEGDGHDEDEFADCCYEFYRHYHDFVPSWVDWEELQRGMDLFITYSPVAGIALFYLSLVPGFSIPKITKVLEQTRYLVPPSTPTQIGHRLMDTGGFVSNAMMTDKSGLAAAPLRPGGKAWKMALQVRVLHAKVRRAILENKRMDWDVETYGIPINQEDMAATLLAFSVNVLIGIGFVSGRDLPVESQKSYLALWRYIGWLLGVGSDERRGYPGRTPHSNEIEPLDPCGTRLSNPHGDDSIIHARASWESFLLHLMDPDGSSSTTAKHLLSVGRSPPTIDGKGHGTQKGNDKKKKNKGMSSFGYMYRCFMCRRFVGDPLADALHLPKPIFTNWRSTAAYMSTTAMLMILRVYTLLTMKSCWFRKKAYDRHLNLIVKFDLAWRENNRQRMKKSLLIDGAKGDEGDYSSCPFQLVMPPGSTMHTDLSHNNRQKHD